MAVFALPSFYHAWHHLQNKYAKRNWRIKTNQSVWGDLMIMHSSTNTGTPDQVYAFKITQGSSAANTGTHVYGALSKASGSFRIDHPLPSKKDSHDLVHSFVEGPRADLIYTEIRA